jgi:hypothetical protein
MFADNTTDSMKNAIAETADEHKTDTIQQGIQNNTQDY